jgi:hypothetical protein
MKSSIWKTILNMGSFCFLGMPWITRRKMGFFYLANATIFVKATNFCHMQLKH